jgi:predicted lipoprotein with Yx(FWY)xxD motif
VATAQIGIAQKTNLGQYLVDGQGHTLYIFLKDTKNTSRCNAACAQLWPPLLVQDAVQPDAGMNAALIGSIVRSDGTKQVTYNGWPLYTYVPDKQPGDTLGEGIGNVWFAVSPRGVKAVVAVNPKTAKTAPGTRSNNRMQPSNRMRRPATHKMMTNPPSGGY